MKKILSMIPMIIAIVITVHTIAHAVNWRFDDFSVTQEELEEIMASRTASDTGLLEEITLDGQELLFDETSDMFYYSLTDGSNTAYNPHVGKRINMDVSIAILDAQITDEDIAQDRTYRVIAYTDEFYYEYGLKCTTLPIMNIECAQEIGDDDAAMSMTLYDNREGISGRVTSSDGNIHVRGGSTKGYPKKGYKLSLTKEDEDGNESKNKVELLGLRSDDDWILYAAYNDQEKIRNVFSSNLWKYTCAEDNSLGVDNGYEYKYIELFVNNEYWGLYALGYKPDEKQLDIDTEAGERLYKKTSWDSEENILTTDKNGVQDRYGIVIQGYESEDTEIDNAWEQLVSYYITLSTSWYDSDAMYAGIDLDNAIDMYLFINLIQGLDNAAGGGTFTIKNMYISFHDTDSGMKVLYTPWDMDISWRKQWTGDSDTNLITAYGTPASQNTVMELSNLGALISSGDDEVWGYILQKYKELRADKWSEEYIGALIDEYEADIYASGAYLRDMERWPDGTYQDVDLGLSVFKEYVYERLQEMDNYIGRVEELVTGDNPTDNLYIIRSAQYDNFLQSDFQLSIQDESVLDDEDYAEFFEYIGIDADEITLNSSLDVDAQLFFTQGEKTSEFDFTKQYVMWAYLLENQDPTLWCDKIKSSGYNVLIEIVNHDVIGEERFVQLLEGFGVDAESVSETTDFVAVDNANGEATLLDNSHESGTRASTAIGELSVFYNDEGGYGVYIDSNECLYAAQGDNDGVDVRIAVIASDPYEVIWTPTLKY